MTDALDYSGLMKNLMENSKDNIYFKDREGRITLINQAGVEWLGYSRPEELIGKTDLDIFTEEHGREGHEDDLRVMQTGISILGKEERETWADRHETWVSTSKFPLKNDEGEIVGTFGISRNITEHKRAEEMLLLMQASVERSLDAVYWMGPDAKFIYVNHTATEALGYSKQELLGMTVHDIDPEFPAEVWLAHWKELKAEKTSLIHTIHQRKDGSTYPVEVMLNLIEFEGREINCAIARDVTDRMRAAQALQENAERFRGMFEHMSSGVAIYEAVDDGEDFIFVDFNPAGERIEKIARRDVIGKRLLEIFPASKEMGLFEVLQRVWRTGKPEHFPVSLYKDGRVEGWRENHIYRLPSGEVVAVYDDRTAQKQAEMERERLITAIDQVAETIVITDVEGTILYVNPAFEQITGYSREEALGETPRILKSGRHTDAFYADMWNTLLSGKTWNGRIVNRRKDEKLYTEEATISPVKDRTGKNINYVAIKSDITAELAWEERFRQTQKMETVGRLAGGIAHDFNNILQTITGFCELILVEMDEQSAQRQDVIEIQKAAHLAGKLTQQLLTFSREKSTQYEEIDINTVLSEGQKMLVQSLDGRFRLKLDLDPQGKPTVADASQILQIALNLVVNARDAMPDGGTITICTQSIEVDQNDLSAWPTARIGEWVCFSVSDTGSGMDEIQLGHLFEPFYTTKKLGEGTGLGLSVVYGIVEEHGGWIHVESEPGKGTLFRICLPVRGAGEADVAAGVLERDEFKGKRILLVEDDAVVRELTAEILQDVDYAVVSVESVQEATEVFARKNGAFDLLFVDIMLPDGNGIELVDTLLKQKEDIPVLLASGHVDEQINMDLIKEKGLNFVRKPYNLSRLLGEVNALLGGR